MKSKLTVTALTSVLYIFNTAQAANPKQLFVQVCPEPSAIQSSGLNAIFETRKNIWAAKASNNNYGTNVTWTFIIKYIFADDGATASKMATETLNSLTFESGPVYDDRLGIWICYYNGSNGRPMVVTPPLNDTALASISLLQ